MNQKWRSFLDRYLYSSSFALIRRRRRRARADKMAGAVFTYAVVLLLAGVVKGMPSVNLEELALVNECTEYKELSSPDRSVDYTNDAIDKCDAELAPGWYRFTKSAGSHMVTQCVSHHHCSALYPGWLNGTHPELYEGVVGRTVCFQSDESCCYGSMKVLVRNCGDFFVYLLFGVPCPFRYCGSHTPRETALPPPLKPIQSAQSTEAPTEAPTEPTTEPPALTTTPSAQSTEPPPFPSPNTNRSLPSTRPTTLPMFPSAFKSHRISDECHDYSPLTGKNRSAAYYNPFYATGDYELPTGWYRFMGEAGTMMPNSCVPIFHCGTHAPGWLLGGHPNDATNHSVHRTVCFHWKDECCFFKVDILVRRCEGYFVYKLQQNEFKYLRYCGNGIP